MNWELILGLACVGVIWTSSKPTTWLVNKIFINKDNWLYEMLTCCLCSTWHIYFWTILLWQGRIDILGACICSCLGEFIYGKLSSGKLI